MQKDLFKKEFSALQQVYLKTLSSNITFCYWTVLKDKFTDEEFSEACKWIIEVGDGFFPTASKFFEWKRNHVTRLDMPDIKCKTCEEVAVFGGESDYELTYECLNGHITVRRVK